MATGTQPRGKSWPALVSEDKYVLSLRGPSDAFSRLKEGSRLESDTEVLGTTLPAGTRVLRHTQLVNDGGNGGSDVTRFFGIPWSPEEFVEQSKRLDHPYRSFPSLRPSILEAMEKIIKQGPDATRRGRKAALSYWEERARKLRCKEERLHDKLDPLVRNVIQGKKVLLLKEMLVYIDYPDVAVVDELISGFRLVGDILFSPVFPAATKQATGDAKWVFANARTFQTQAFTDCRSSGDPELDREVYKKTQEEEAAGILSAPLSAEQVKEIVGELWVPVPRRGIWQKEKARLIDDYSRFYINSLVTTLNKLSLMGVDEVAGIAKAWGMMFEQHAKDKATGWDKFSPSHLRGTTIDLFSSCL